MRLPLTTALDPPVDWGTLLSLRGGGAPTIYGSESNPSAALDSDRKGTRSNISRLLIRWIGLLKVAPCNPNSQTGPIVLYSETAFLAQNTLRPIVLYWAGSSTLTPY